MSKKGQGAEYIGIVILIILLVLFVLFNRISGVSETALKTKENIRDYQTIYDLVSHSIFPYLTTNKIPFLELFSWYTCFGNESADYNFGQIQVIHDILGLFEDFVPRHTKRYASLADAIRDALQTYRQEVGDGRFPTEEHS